LPSKGEDLKSAVQQNINYGFCVYAQRPTAQIHGTLLPCAKDTFKTSPGNINLISQGVFISFHKFSDFFAAMAVLGISLPKSPLVYYLTVMGSYLAQFLGPSRGPVTVLVVVQTAFFQSFKNIFKKAKLLGMGKNGP